MARIGLIAGGCVLLLLAAGWWHASRRVTAKVDKGTVGERLIARAAVVPGAGVAHVFPAADGRVASVRVREGERVEAGALLAELEAGGKREPLKAAARGVVLARRIEVGDWALSADHGAREPYFVLADPTQTELRLEVEEVDAARIATGQSVAIRATGFGSGPIQGKVERVAAQLEPRSIGADDARARSGGLVRAAQVSWSGPNPGWPIGARAEAIIELRREHAEARLPRSALTVREGRTLVHQPFAFWSREVPVEVVSADDVHAAIRGLPVGSEVLVLE
jgi:hypothetical protein